LGLINPGLEKLGKSKHSSVQKKAKKLFHMLCRKKKRDGEGEEVRDKKRGKKQTEGEKQNKPGENLKHE